MVAEATRNVAAAQEEALQAQARAAAQSIALEEARQKSVEAEARVAAASAQERAAARKAADEAAAKYNELQGVFVATKQALQQSEAKAAQQALKLQQLEAQLLEQASKNPQELSPAETAQIANGIPACEQNAATVRDPETGLLLVCESQIITSAQFADVGTTRHVSGRYYILPFPDHSMIFAGKKATYKYACGSHFCEWLKRGGSLDVEYGAASADGKYYRFTSCRTGLENKRICAVPPTGFPEGVEYRPDGREPEMPMVGPDVDATDVSGTGGFRAGAARQAPAGCAVGQAQVPVLPWPGRDRFHQRPDGMWQALFYGGNCLGDVRVETQNPDAPEMVFYSMSASQSWPRFRFDVAGPNGQKMALTHASPYEGGEPSCMHRNTRLGWAEACAYKPVGMATTDTGNTPPAVPPVTPPPPATTPVTDASTTPAVSPEQTAPTTTPSIPPAEVTAPPAPPATSMPSAEAGTPGGAEAGAPSTPATPAPATSAETEAGAPGGTETGATSLPVVPAPVTPVEAPAAAPTAEASAATGA